MDWRPILPRIQVCGGLMCCSDPLLVKWGERERARELEREHKRSRKRQTEREILYASLGTFASEAGNRSLHLRPDSVTCSMIGSGNSQPCHSRGDVWVHLRQGHGGVSLSQGWARREDIPREEGRKPPPPQLCHLPSPACWPPIFPLLPSFTGLVRKEKSILQLRSARKICS